MKSKNVVHMIVAILFSSAFPVLAASSVTIEILAVFDFPGAPLFTSAAGINDQGDVAGIYDDALGTHGFVRFSDGHFSGPITDPNDPNGFTELTGINNRKTLCGFSTFGSFLLSRRIFAYVTTSATATTVNGVNDAGNFCGYTSGPDTNFVTIGGTTIFFQIPGSAPGQASDINNLDQCVGYYFTTGLQAGFRRDADGTLTYPILVPGETSTYLYGINDSGAMVGEVVNTTGTHAVFFQPSGEATIYDYPRATDTSFTGINNNGLICGRYTHNGTHAFIARVR